MSDIDNALRYQLPEADAQRIFREQIVPGELARGVPQERPAVVFVIGQPGAGKTRTTDAIKEQLDQRGGAVVVNSDVYKAYHPQYSRLLAENDRTAAPLTSADGRRWTAMSEAHLIAGRVDTIIETTARNPAYFAEQVARYRSAGYRVEAAILAVPEAASRLGIVHRYHDQVQQLGHGRFTPQANHDDSYYGVSAVARAIDKYQLADAVTVYRRGNVQVGVNYLAGGAGEPGAGEWRWPERSTTRTLDIERNRQWTPEETRAFASTLAQLGKEMGPAWHQELTAIGNLALPFAAPGTGTAGRTQPTAGQQFQQAADRPHQAPGADQGRSDSSR